MANKRNLKKEIKLITASLIEEYLLTASFVPGIDIEKANTVLSKIIALRDEYLARVGANGGNEPKLVKAFYRQLKADFNAQVDEIISDFETLTK